MEPKSSGSSKKHDGPFRFYIVIFFVGLLFTVTLWDAYSNGSRPFDKEIASHLILIMGTLFSAAAGLFTWSLETRKSFLEKEIDMRTKDLHEKNQELIRKNEEVENFIHIISHDLKAPLVSIQGFTSILKSEMGSAMNQAQLDYLNRIQINAQQMNVLILDLLEFSRVGRIEDEKQSVNMAELIKEIVAELKPEIDRCHVSVRFNEDLPVLWGSKKRLSQVFTNLITNAIKYMGPKQSPQIDIGYSKNGSIMSTLWVKDNGIGIKKEYQEKIFQIFQRVPNQLKVEGTGIGLSIVKKIVGLNGGEVWVKSEEGKGSQFFVQWPMNTLPADAVHNPEMTGSAK